MTPPVEVDLNNLTRRQKEVAGLIAQAFTNRAIAETMCLREKTVDNYVSQIYHILYADKGTDNYARRVMLASHWHEWRRE